MINLKPCNPTLSFFLFFCCVYDQQQSCLATVQQYGKLCNIELSSARCSACITISSLATVPTLCGLVIYL